MTQRENDAADAQAQQAGADADPQAPDRETAATQADAPGAGDELAAKMAELQAKADQHWEQLLRTQAEMENVRRRAEKDVESAHKFAVEKFAAELLPVRDSLEMGLEAAQGDNVDIAKVVEGMDLTLKMLRAAMEKFAIAEVAPHNEKFNPDLHQAMSVQPSADVEPNTVLMVYQKGYTLNDRLLRPAMVVVSKAAGEGSGGGDAQQGGKVDEMA